MKLETATIVPGSESPIGEGVNGAVRCVLRLADGSRRAAVVKRLSHRAVLTEAFCALLLGAWGLNVPQPFLVSEGASVSFGSADGGYPNLKQRLALDAMPDGDLKRALLNVAYNLVAGFEQTPIAVMADEAIDNRDRNLGNILWDGLSEAWIDHEVALGLGSHFDDMNKVAVMVGLTPGHEAVCKSAIAAWMTLDRSCIDPAASLTGAASLGAFVANRLTGLGTRILARFPSPQDLLSPHA